MLRLVVWYPLRWILQILPVAWGFRILRFMGKLHFLAAAPANSPLLDNPAPIIPEKKWRKQALKQYFINHYCDQLFILIAPKFTKKTISTHVEIQGLENLDNALDHGKGVVLVHGHLGPAHLPLVVLSILGYQMNQIGNLSDKGLSWIGKNVAFRLRMAYEKKIPAPIVKAGSFLRPVFRALNNNEVVMLTGDGTGRDKKYGLYHEFVFFNQSMKFPIGPAGLSEKTGAVLLPLFVRPGTGRLYSIVIEKPLTPDNPTPNRKNLTNVLDLTQNFIRLFEDKVREFPGYWHFLDRFSPGQLIEEHHAL